MLKRMIVWGVVGGLVGAVIGSKESHDPSGAAALYGCGLGVVIAVMLVLLFSRPGAR